MALAIRLRKSVMYFALPVDVVILYGLYLMVL